MSINKIDRLRPLQSRNSYLPGEMSTQNCRKLWMRFFPLGDLLRTAMLECSNYKLELNTRSRRNEMAYITTSVNQLIRYEMYIAFWPFLPLSVLDGRHPSTASERWMGEGPFFF
jgi:hypothetical protein